MIELKFNYIYRSDEGEIINRGEETTYTLQQIEEGEVYNYLTVSGSICRECIAKRQYTGLKDKNGVEIYEGDILRNNNGGSEYTDIVEYRNGRYPVFYEYSDYLNPEKKFEIIGNIYENPELINN